MRSVAALVFHPPAEVEKFDTSLRFTDILFGFVIKEIFIRLQDWERLTVEVFGHLVVTFLLVLGSWVGYRRSVNRSHYQVKFFNLPLVRFACDQVMLILYFRLAVLTPIGGNNGPAPCDLARHTAELITLAFVAYLVWDLCGIGMDRATADTGGVPTPRYPVIIDGKRTDLRKSPDFYGMLITLAGLICMSGLVAAAFGPMPTYVSAGLLLLAYRWAKEVRTSWRAS